MNISSFLINLLLKRAYQRLITTLAIGFFHKNINFAGYEFYNHSFPLQIMDNDLLSHLLHPIGRLNEVNEV